MKCSMFFVLTFLSWLMAAASPPPKPLNTPSGTVVWYPDRYNGHDFLSVTRLHGNSRLQVYVNPAYTYQKYTTSTAVYDSGYVIEYSEHYEVIIGLKPAQAASGWGVRDSSREDDYTRVEWFSVPQRAEGELWARLVIKSNGTDRYMLIVTRRRLKDNANLKDRIDA